MISNVINRYGTTPYPLQLSGLSTDEKPDNAPDNSLFFELDTNKIYYCVQGYWGEVGTEVALPEVLLEPTIIPKADWEKFEGNNYYTYMGDASLGFQSNGYDIIFSFTCNGTKYTGTGGASSDGWYSASGEEFDLLINNSNNLRLYPHTSNYVVEDDIIIEVLGTAASGGGGGGKE